MKFTLDFNTKTVHVEEPCNLQELVDFMSKHGELKERIVQGSDRVVYYPTIPDIPNYPFYPQPISPYYCGNPEFWTSNQKPDNEGNEN